MAATIDQKEYLKKYLSGNKSDEKKKKKKKRIKAGAGVKIIDDDMDVSKMRSVDDAEIEMMFEGDDAPQIAGIIDDRPEALKNTDDVGRGTKWRVIGQDDGSNFNFSVQELSHKIKKTKKTSPHVSDLDQSPPHLNTTIKKHKPTSDDSNANSVIRKDAKHNRVDSNQNHRHEKRPHDYSSPTRKPDKTSTHSDKSPPRKKTTNSKPNVPRSVDRRKESDSDLSPPRNDKQNSDSDLSPPRNAGNNSDLSPPRKRERYTRNSEVDTSPPRRKNLDKFKSCDGDLSPPRRHQKADSGNHYESNSRGSNSHSRNRRRDSDQSPPRQKSRSDRKGSTNRDLSPQRRSNKDSDGRKRSRWGPEEERSAPSAEQNTRAGDKMKTTLDGKTAGLQDAKNLVAESRTIRRREDEMFAQMSEDVSGRNAKAVVRNRGRKETSAEREAQRQKEEQQKERDAKYARWGKGLKQTEAQEANVRDYLHEASKPLARYKSDVDLDDQLRQQDREGDPMLEYLRSKGKNVRPDDTDVKPIYKGAYPPNRFNIRPGYRWDGVDRSNGYENKFFDSKNKKIAQESDAYKWSTEDM